MNVRRIFARGATRGFFQEGPKVVKFVFSHSKLKKTTFFC